MEELVINVNKKREPTSIKWKKMSFPSEIRNQIKKTLKSNLIKICLVFS